MNSLVQVILVEFWKETVMRLWGRKKRLVDYASCAG